MEALTPDHVQTALNALNLGITIHFFSAFNGNSTTGGRCHWLRDRTNCQKPVLSRA
jgi:hypothetical protein